MTQNNPFDKAICPGCGWTGSTHSVSKHKTCPRCKDYEGVDSLRAMLNGDSLDWNGVHMPEFLGALQKLGVLQNTCKERDE